MSEVAEKRVTALHPMRLRAAEYERAVYVADIEFGLKPEDIVDPGFWAHVASKLPPYTQIEARAEDGSWIAYLVVTGSDRTWARVAVDRIVKLTTKDVAESQAARHKVEWKGPVLKYAVIRNADGAVIKNGFRERAEAAQALVEHERVTGGPPPL